MKWKISASLAPQGQFQIKRERDFVPEPQTQTPRLLCQEICINSVFYLQRHPPPLKKRCQSEGSSKTCQTDLNVMKWVIMPKNDSRFRANSSSFRKTLQSLPQADWQMWTSNVRATRGFASFYVENIRHLKLACIWKMQPVQFSWVLSVSTCSKLQTES